MLCLGFSDLASGDRDVRIGLPAIDLAQRDAIPEDPARREEDELLASSDRTGPAQLNRYLLALVVSQNWRRLLHHFIDLHNDRARGRSDLRQGSRVDLDDPTFENELRWSRRFFKAFSRSISGVDDAHQAQNGDYVSNVHAAISLSSRAEP